MSRERSIILAQGSGVIVGGSRAMRLLTVPHFTRGAASFTLLPAECAQRAPQARLLLQVRTDSGMLLLDGERIFTLFLPKYLPIFILFDLITPRIQQL